MKEGIIGKAGTKPSLKSNRILHSLSLAVFNKQKSGGWVRYAV